MEYSAVHESILRIILLDPLYYFDILKESISSFLLLFSSLQKRGSLLFFLLFIFEIRARVALDPFMHSIKFIIF